MGKTKRFRPKSEHQSMIMDIGGPTYEDFKKYYMLQKIMPDDEWDDFLDAIRRPLTTAFRLKTISSQYKEMQRILEEDDFKLRELEAEGLTYEDLKFTAPKKVTWHPSAWTMSFPKSKLKKIEQVWPFRAWLMKMSTLGEITRMELVSMLPVQVLDVKSHHAVLDMCASPGSKTTQLLEAIHRDENGNHLLTPSGFVIANEPNYKRCFTLCSNINRLTLPNFMVIGRMGQCLPNMLINPESGNGKPQHLLFDRVLCDVPCTGDGTARKNPEIWETWSRNHGNIFHRIQHAIAKRGCEMLKEGGLLVYSTCSLNPMENESVIAQLLRDFNQLELVDLSDKLPGLKRVPGMSTWKVSDIHGNVIPSLKDVRKRHIKRFFTKHVPSD